MPISVFDSRSKWGMSDNLTETGRTKMNKLQKLTVVLTALLLGSGVALAEECSGINGRVSENNVVLHTAEDGTVTTFLRSTGVSTLITPVSEANTGWQHCSGLMVAKADKSASASGICYRVSLNGDQEIVSWQFDSDSRTWKRESGTGEMSGAASGTWEWAVQMGNGLGINSWKGDCE
jgi:hypothetical protein